MPDQRLGPFVMFFKLFLNGASDLMGHILLLCRDPHCEGRCHERVALAIIFRWIVNITST